MIAARVVQSLAAADSKHAINTPHPTTGLRPLSVACASGRLAVVAALLEEGALPDLPDHPAADDTVQATKYASPKLNHARCVVGRGRTLATISPCLLCLLRPAPPRKLDGWMMMA